MYATKNSHAQKQNIQSNNVIHNTRQEMGKCVEKNYCSNNISGAVSH